MPACRTRLPRWSAMPACSWPAPSAYSRSGSTCRISPLSPALCRSASALACSRVRVTIEVGYDSDVDAVRHAMLAAAEDDPRILPSPPPRVFLSKLGSATLEFELTAIVTSIETLPAVRSDLHLRVLKNFREK